MDELDSMHFCIFDLPAIDIEIKHVISQITLEDGRAAINEDYRIHINNLRTGNVWVLPERYWREQEAVEKVRRICELFSGASIYPEEPPGLYYLDYQQK